MVWVPANTGSHIGGRSVEVDEGGAAAAGALNVGTGSAEAVRLNQLQSTSAALAPSGSDAIGGGP
jgi:hypothetical protein